MYDEIFTATAHLVIDPNSAPDGFDNISDLVDEFAENMNHWNSLGTGITLASWECENHHVDVDVRLVDAPAHIMRNGIKEEFEAGLISIIKEEWAEYIARGEIIAKYHVDGVEEEESDEFGVMYGY